MSSRSMWITGGVLGLILGFGLTRMPGCTPPQIVYHGQTVGVGELDAVVAGERLKAQNEAQDKLAYLMAEQKQKEVAFKNTVAKLGNNHAAEVADLSAKYEQDGNTALAAMEKVGRDTNALLDRLSTEGDQAKTHLIDMYAQRNALASGIGQVTSMIPGAAPFQGLINSFLPIVLGVGGAASMARMSKTGTQKADDAYDEGHAAATAAAEAKTKAADAAWHEAQHNLLLTLHSPTAAMQTFGAVATANSQLLGGPG